MRQPRQTCMTHWVRKVWGLVVLPIPIRWKLQDNLHRLMSEMTISHWQGLSRYGGLVAAAPVVGVLAAATAWYFGVPVPIPPLPWPFAYRVRCSGNVCFPAPFHWITGDMELYIFYFIICTCCNTDRKVWINTTDAKRKVYMLLIWFWNWQQMRMAQSNGSLQ